MTNPRTGSDAGVRESIDHHDDDSQILPAAASPSDIPAQLRRRRAASRRSEPLESGLRDPLDHPVHEPLTDAELDSWRAAWRHLHALELPAVIPERIILAAGNHAGDS